mgnify:CR=1 FL=1
MYSVDDVTFVSGYWMVERPIKYEFNHYHNLIPKTFAMLENKNIVFFYEDKGLLHYINNYIKTNKFVSYFLSSIDLPANEITKSYVDTCKQQDDTSLKKSKWSAGGFEKGLGKKSMMLKHELSYATQISIMFSKSFLVQKVIEANPFNTNYFAWIDLSIARFKDKRKNWDFTKFNFTDEHMYHYSSFMRNYGKLQKLNGSFLLGHKSKWEDFIPIYEDELIKLKSSKYCHSDESVITSVINKHPKLFNAIDNGELPNWK